MYRGKIYRRNAKVDLNDEKNYCLATRTKTKRPRDRLRDREKKKEKEIPREKEKERFARRILRVLPVLAYYLTPTYAQRLESCHRRPFHRDPRPSDRFCQHRRLLIYGHCTASCHTALTTHGITRVSHDCVLSFSRVQQWTKKFIVRQKKRDRNKGNNRCDTNPTQQYEQERVPRCTDGNSCERRLRGQRLPLPHRVRPSCTAPSLLLPYKFSYIHSYSPDSARSFFLKDQAWSGREATLSNSGTLYHQPFPVEVPHSTIMYWLPPPCNLTLVVGQRKGVFLKQKGDRRVYDHHPVRLVPMENNRYLDTTIFFTDFYQNLSQSLHFFFLQNIPSINNKHDCIIIWSYLIRFI